jgi:hypothetical protein
VYSLLADAAFVARLSRPADVQAQLAVLEALYERDAAQLRARADAARAVLHARAEALRGVAE